MDILTFAIHLVAGLFGGNVVGQAASRLSLGTAWNSILGMLGGAVGGGVGAWLMQGAGDVTRHTGEAVVKGFDLDAILAHVGTAGVGGGLLLALAGLIARRRSS